MSVAAQAASVTSNSSPLGATIFPSGANFSVFSRGATAVDLLLFDREDDPRPARVIPFDPLANRAYHYWHTFVPGLRPGQLYGYRVHGPFDPASGMRFDPAKILLDPYGRGVVVPRSYSRNAAWLEGDNAATAMKSVVVDTHAYDWEGDKPLHRPSSRTIIYEMHVRGFTRHPGSGIADKLRGTYAGLIEKIPYLQQLGITAIELLPVFQFDAQDAPPGRVNYWGYASVSFFAPHQAYSSRQDPLGPVNEFRDMVKALHRAGLEVILDVVFNHTAEGNELGPILSFKGIDNASYYRLLPDKKRYYINDTGTGNTLNLRHARVIQMVTDSLRYWVEQTHVDGFRFDHGTILAREPNGFDHQSGFLKACSQDPVLGTVKLIAEPWDCGPGGYQVGAFPPGWAEWNDKFRDNVRDYWRGQAPASAITPRLCASGDFFNRQGRKPWASVNFITAHDGFTLNDLVSYNEKHNEANGENNRDGSSDNRSWNCGAEGPTADPAINKVRQRQMRNLLGTLLLSQGTPMMLAGDEFARTQQGNNNAYCQDNEISWLDWNLAKRNQAQVNFVQKVVALRHKYPVLRRNRFLTGQYNEELGLKDVMWINANGSEMQNSQWADTNMHCFGMLMDGRAQTSGVKQLGHDVTLLLVLNVHQDLVQFTLPKCIGGDSWTLLIDTNAPAQPEGSTFPTEAVYGVTAHSLLLFELQSEKK